MSLQIVAQHLKVFLQQLLPRRIAQRCCRMERGHYYKMPHLVEPAAQLSNANLGLKHKVRRGVAERHNNIGPDASNLLTQKRRASQHFLGTRIAVSRRAALKHVGNVDVFAFEARQRQNAVEVLACRPHKGLALQILIAARRLTNKHHASAGVSHAKHDIVTRLVELAEVTIAQNGLNFLECDLTWCLMGMAGNVHDAHGDSYT